MLKETTSTTGTDEAIVQCHVSVHDEDGITKTAEESVPVENQKRGEKGKTKKKDALRARRFMPPDMEKIFSLGGNETFNPAGMTKREKLLHRQLMKERELKILQYGKRQAEIKAYARLIELKKPKIEKDGPDDFDLLLKKELRKIERRDQGIWKRWLQKAEKVALKLIDLLLLVGMIFYINDMGEGSAVFWAILGPMSMFTMTLSMSCAKILHDGKEFKGLAYTKMVAISACLGYAYYRRYKESWNPEDWDSNSDFDFEAGKNLASNEFHAWLFLFFASLVFENKKHVYRFFEDIYDYINYGPIPDDREYDLYESDSNCPDCG